MHSAIDFFHEVITLAVIFKITGEMLAKVKSLRIVVLQKQPEENFADIVR